MHIGRILQVAPAWGAPGHGQDAGLGEGRRRGNHLVSSSRSLGTKTPTRSSATASLLQQYGCGPVALTGTDDALYERHLAFDQVIDPAQASPRERYEAIARSVRDVLSQRWVRTES